jgi:WD40 repeat protein
MIVSQAALHVYRSALPFTPKSTHIYQTYYPSNVHLMPEVLNGIPSRWEGYKMLKGHGSVVRRICFSPDSHKFASGSRDGCLNLWDSTTGAIVGRYSRHPAPRISLIAFTPDGNTIITDSSDREALVWDGETGRYLDIELNGHEGRITALIISPDGQYLMTGSEDCSILMWNLKTFQVLGAPLRAHSFQIEHLLISPDGHFMASAAKGECAIWSTSTLSIHKMSRNLHKRVTAMTFNPQSTGLLTCGSDGTVLYTWIDLEKNEDVALGCHSSWVTCCVISADGTWGASCEESGTIYFWDLLSFSQKGQSQKYTGYTLSQMVLCEDQKQLIVTTDNEILMLCDVITGEITVGPFQGENGFSTASAISPEQTYVAIGNVNGGISLWDLRDLEQVEASPLEIRENSVGELKLSPNRNIIATSATNYNIVRLWNATTGKIIGDGLRGHDSPITCIEFSHNSCLLATGSQDGAIRIWKIENGLLSCSPIYAHQDRITTLGFSFDDTRFVSGSMDGTLDVWSAQTGERIHGPFMSHTSMIVVAIYMRSGTILSTSKDGTTLLWEPAAMNDTSSIQVIKHFGQVHKGDLIISRDENYLACASKEKRLELWKLNPRPEHIANHLRVIEINRRHFYFSNDNKYVWYEDHLYRLEGSSG